MFISTDKSGICIWFESLLQILCWCCSALGFLHCMDVGSVAQGPDSGGNMYPQNNSNTVHMYILQMQEQNCQKLWKPEISNRNAM
jgi:hypothetical protein